MSPFAISAVMTLVHPAPAVGERDSVTVIHTARSMESFIRAHDPFQNPSAADNPEACGPLRALNTIRAYFQDFPSDSPWYYIHDDVVMDYWESHNDDVYWTPLCSSRSDVP